MSPTIAFDLDDTLVRCGAAFPLELPTRPWLHKLGGTELLRQGTTDLIRTLAAEGWGIWVYTTSFRSSFSIRMTFAAYGLPLRGTVNQRHHDKLMQ